MGGPVGVGEGEFVIGLMLLAVPFMAESGVVAEMPPRAAEMRLYAREGSGEWFELETISGLPGEEIRFQPARHLIGGLQGGTEVRFYATALNEFGESVPSEVLETVLPFPIYVCGLYRSESEGWCHL